MFSSVGSKRKGSLKPEALMPTSQPSCDHRNYKNNFHSSGIKNLVVASTLGIIMEITGVDGC